MNFTNAGSTNLVDPTGGGGGISPGEDANFNLNANAGIHLANITGVTLTNNFIVTSSIPVFSGGTVTDYGVTPTNITVQYNYTWRPWKWFPISS